MLPTYNNNSNTGAAKPSSPIIPLRQPLEAYICRSFLRHGHCRYGGCAHRPRGLDGVSLHGGDYARLASLTPPASDGSSSGEDERRTTEERYHPPPPGSLVAGSLQQQQQQLTGHHNLVFLPELPLWAVTTTPATVAVAESVATSHQQQAMEGGGSGEGCKYLHLSPDEVVPTLERLVREGWGFVTCCINHQNRSGCTRFGHHAPMCKYLHISRKEEAEWATYMSPHVKELRMAHKLREDKKRAEKDNNSPHASRDVNGGAHRIETRIVAGHGKPATDYHWRYCVVRILPTVSKGTLLPRHGVPLSSH
ncbi:Hypothetical protein, putative [Bodo saltans]|uniref:C3H1-type domain-containing protein n=1 Tax=Bodo saltans TaxID=75058 RepID=A0A0S4IZV4_BODSA|nr:Hypothetical protein, putative [Bodo saltans]|eukprot:CUG30953.1 Hypothetical protein, putative [Bodo saltans]